MMTEPEDKIEFPFRGRRWEIGRNDHATCLDGIAEVVCFPSGGFWMAKANYRDACFSNIVGALNYCSDLLDAGQPGNVTSGTINESEK